MSIVPRITLSTLRRKIPYTGEPVTASRVTSTSRAPRAYTGAMSPEPEPVTLIVPHTSSVV
jgi:hypothetical protein